MQAGIFMYIYNYSSSVGNETQQGRKYCVISKVFTCPCTEEHFFSSSCSTLTPDASELSSLNYLLFKNLEEAAEALCYWSLSSQASSTQIQGASRLLSAPRRAGKLLTASGPCWPCWAALRLPKQGLTVVVSESVVNLGCVGCGRSVCFGDPIELLSDRKS